MLAKETRGRYHRCHNDFDAQRFAHKLLSEGFQDPEVNFNNVYVLLHLKTIKLRLPSFCVACCHVPCFFVEEHIKYRHFSVIKINQRDV